MVERTTPSGIHVWHFDDVSGVLGLASIHLKARGFKVTSIGDPAISESRLNEGLDKKEIDLLILDGSIDYPGQIGVITSDKIPALSGVTLAEVARRRVENLPIVLCSTQSALFDQHRNLFDSFIDKPFRAIQFNEGIDKAWKARRG